MQTLAPYLGDRRRFDRQNSDQLLGPYDLDWRSYLPRLLEYATTHGFLHRSDRTVHEQVLFRRLGVFVFVLAVWIWRTVAAGHPARRAAVASAVFIVVEALLGAGLVLFRLVAQDESLARAMVMPLHLANTMVLLLCLTLTAHFLSGGAPIAVAGRTRTVGVLAVLLVLMIGVGKTGAIAALGDTLYPASSLLEGLKADFAPTTSVLLRLRVLHPALGVAVGAMLVFGTAAIPLAADDRRGRLARRAVVALAAVQVVVGFVNVWLLAPIWLQLTHLLIADLRWIALVVLTASARARREAPAVTSA